MIIHKVIGRKCVPWTDEAGNEHVSVQLHCINESPAAEGFEGVEVEVVKCNPQTIPLCETVKLGETVFIQRNDKGRAVDVVPLSDLAKLGK